MPEINVISPIGELNFYSFEMSGEQLRSEADRFIELYPTISKSIVDTLEQIGTEVIKNKIPEWEIDSINIDHPGRYFITIVSPKSKLLGFGVELDVMGTKVASYELLH